MKVYRNFFFSVPRNSQKSSPYFSFCLTDRWAVPMPSCLCLSPHLELLLHFHWEAVCPASQALLKCPPPDALPDPPHTAFSPTPQLCSACVARETLSCGSAAAPTPLRMWVKLPWQRYSLSAGGVRNECQWDRALVLLQDK